MPPRRPVLRITRAGGEEQVIVCPGPALGRSHWIGLIPDDATRILLAAAPSARLERVGRRSEASILLECAGRKPGNAIVALAARARGQARRWRDTLRGGVAVTRQGRFAAWASTRRVPYAGPAPDLAIRCIVLTTGADSEAVGRTLATLRAQTLRADAVTVSDPTVGSPAALLAGADALCVLHAGDILAPDALALLAACLSGADLAYADEVDADGWPRLKPDWSPDLARATGYIGRIAVLSRALIERLPDSPLGPIAHATQTLELRAAEACRHAVHCPRPLATVGAPSHRAVAPTIWPLPEPAPLVSVVIPSRDRLDLIGPVCRGILQDTDYPTLELIVVDNGSTDPSVLAFYEDLTRHARVRVVPFPQAFNFSAMVNAGVEAATGKVVVLLNNDIGVRRPGWLGAMVRQAIRPEVGAVGAKLLFGDGTLQHAGVVVGLAGRAGHILRRRPADTPGHLGRLRVAHEVSAVTAACLAVSRDKYRAVGGFDAEAFPIDFNDVDFCLRLGAKGWKTVWTPEAELFHFESVSRGPSVGAKRARFEREAALFTQRWLDVIRHDPFYHPALSLTTFGEDLE